MVYLERNVFDIVIIIIYHSLSFNFRQKTKRVKRTNRAMEGGGAAPPADTVMSDAAPPPQQAMAMGIENIPATLSHGGRFIQYNIFGNIFEVTAKYKPPIMPIGKGAYGIVWYSLTLFAFPPFRIKSNPKFAFFFF